MENEPELIRDQMQETRTSLTEKLDTLQQKVTDTVESITTPVTETVQKVEEVVTETVDTVKETVAETVDTVKETFNLSHQVERHPWPMMIGSLAAGYLLGRLLPPPGQLLPSLPTWTDDVAARMAQPTGVHNGSHRAGEREEAPPAKKEEEGMFGGLADVFRDEFDQLKALGVSVGVGLLRDLLTQSIQGEVGDRLKGWMDDLTSRLGANPLKEPLVAPEPEQQPPARGAGRDGPEKDGGRAPSAGKTRKVPEAKPRW